MGTTLSRLTAFILLLAASISSADNIDDARADFFSNNFASAQSKFKALESSAPGEANYYLGLIASTQSSPYFDLKKASAYFELGAQHGHAQSAQELSQLYYQNADSLDPSYLTAIAWQRTSDQLTLDQNTDSPHFRDGTPITKEQALRDQINQAEQDDADMQFNLGRRYDFAIGMAQDVKQASYWYLRSANNGSYTGATYAAFALCKGLGTEQDSDQANHWFTQINHPARCPKITGK